MSNETRSWFPGHLLVVQPLNEFPPGSIVFRNGHPNKAGGLEVAVRLASPSDAFLITSWFDGHYLPGQILSGLTETIVFGIPAHDPCRLTVDIDLMSPVTETPGGYNDGQATGCISLGVKGPLLHGFAVEHPNPSRREAIVSPVTWERIALDPIEQLNTYTYTRAWRLRLSITPGWDIFFSPPAPPSLR